MGFDINAASDDGATPRDLAVIQEETETVALIDELLAL
jgi:hypothetical protein